MTDLMRRSMLLALALSVVSATPRANAQRVDVAEPANASSADGLDRLREAAGREAAGDLTGAEAMVREVLEANPASLTALLALERLLVVQGRPRDALPALDRLLSADPGSAIGHQMRLRLQAQLGDVAAIDAAIRDWIMAAPHLETPYREAARVRRQRGEHELAVAVLEEGRRRIPLDDALALELGDAHAAAGDLQRAAQEWARAVGATGRGFMLVQRRLHDQPDGGARVVPLLIDQLGGEPYSPGRQRAAALLAIDAGLDAPARNLARNLAAALSPEERDPVLVELARRADGAGLHHVALWSYSELLSSARDPGAALAIRSRVAELALLVADTALAARVSFTLEDAAAPDSPQRRQALALRARLAAGEGDLDAAAASLHALRTEYPQAREQDETAALLARRFIDAGDEAAARQLLAGVAGPRSAQVRARLYMRDGELSRAHEELMRAAPLLQGRDATETLALAALLMRVSPAGGELVARAVAAAEADHAEVLVGVADVARSLPATGRAAVLDFLAAMADRSGLHDDADSLRREIVTTLAGTHEAPAALLALARRALADDDRTQEAVILLERLILDYPRSTLAPQARRELQRLRDRSAS
jgi:tetratricopeptide (TPR) repeat protein